MSQFLYRVEPARPGFLSAPTSDEEAHVEAHFAYLVRLARDGVVLLAGRTLNEDGTTFGIVLLEAPSTDEARNVMRGDPAVFAGVFTAQLFPIRIAIVSPEIVRLAPPRE
jgi:uncharacterized protein